MIAGATTITGLGYIKKDGETRWDSISNINYKLYHTASSYGDMIKSFNVNTNDWVARYIFKVIFQKSLKINIVAHFDKTHYDLQPALQLRDYFLDL